MTRTIENSFLKISVSDHGAELTGIYDKVNGREVLWQADPAYWKRHAPVLFPNVGRNYKDIWRLNGKEYPSRTPLVMYALVPIHTLSPMAIF